MECQQLKNTAREGDLTLCPVITQKQENDQAFRLKPPNIFAQYRSRQTLDVCFENWIGFSKALWTYPLAHTHGFKRKENRAQGIAEKYFYIGRERRWDRQAGEKTQLFGLSLLLTVPLRSHWSQEHMVIWRKCQRLEVHSFRGWRRNVVASIVVHRTILFAWHNK